MAETRFLRALERLVRLAGVGLVAAGLFVSLSSPVFGVPLAGIGLLFALRPRIAAELVELASLFW
jgi:hypothetical protein